MFRFGEKRAYAISNITDHDQTVHAHSLIMILDVYFGKTGNLLYEVALKT